MRWETTGGSIHLSSFKTTKRVGEMPTLFIFQRESDQKKFEGKDVSFPGTISAFNQGPLQALRLFQAFFHLRGGRAVERGICFNQPGKLEYPFLHALEE